MPDLPLRSPSGKPTWYLRSLRDHDTHRGELNGDGLVRADCGVLFTPQRRLQVAGPPPGTLVDADPALTGRPPDPDQICPACEHSGNAG